MQFRVGLNLGDMFVKVTTFMAMGSMSQHDLKHYRNPEASVFLGKSMMRFDENLI